MNVNQVEQFAREQLEGPDFGLVLMANYIGSNTWVETSHHTILMRILSTVSAIRTSSEKAVRENLKEILRHLREADALWEDVVYERKEEDPLLQAAWSDFCALVVLAAAIKLVLDGDPLRCNVADKRLKEDDVDAIKSYEYSRPLQLSKDDPFLDPPVVLLYSGSVF